MRLLGRLAVGTEDVDRRQDGILDILNKLGDRAREDGPVRRGQRSIVDVGQRIKARGSLGVLDLTGRRVIIRLACVSFVTYQARRCSK